MASFDDLGKALRDDAVANAPRASAIDVDAVTHAARARRRPRQWALGSVVVVAAFGIGGASLAAVIPPPAMIAASESARESASDETFLLENDGGAVDLNNGRVAVYDCLQPAADPVASSAPLALTVHFASTTALVDGVVSGEVRMLNTSDAPVQVFSDLEPVVTLMQNGLVLWRTPLIASARVDRLLAPGDSIDFEIRLTPVVCDPQVYAWPFDVSGLNPVEPGEYELSATIGVGIDGDDLVYPVSSPRQTIRIE